MTLTDTTPASDTDAASAPPIEAPKGLAAIVGASDHTAIGRLYIVSSLLFLVTAGVVGALLGAERIDTSNLAVLDEGSLAQMFTFHSVVGSFLFLLPLLVGVATSIVPLQVGAPTIAFPRAAAASFWTYLVCGLLVVASYAINGGPFGGDSDGVDLFVLAFAGVLVALIVAMVCLVTTVISLRAPGVTLARTPLYAWSTLVAGVVWLLTLPVLLGVLVLVYADHRHGRLLLGGNNGVYVRLSWMFGQPALYAFAIPALGVIGDVVPVFSSTRHRLHRVAMGAIGVFAALSVGAWAQPGFLIDGGAPPRAWLFEGPWIAVSFAILLPMLALLGLWAETARAGSVRLSSPLIYAAASALMLLVGLLAGAASSIDPLDVYDTTWTTATAHYVLLATAIALMGAITYWAPKIFGRGLSEAPSRLAATLLLFGTIGLSFPDIVSGALDQVRFFGAVTDEVDTIEALNIVSFLGGAVVIVAVLVFIATLLASARSSELPGDDPWNGHTLEWATSSPPPLGNFATLPDITSEAPLYDARHRAEAEVTS
jgi:heme/copper-type cytochrome/quinol oxidase subunit 1